MQLVLGIPLEMVHGAWRVAAVYTSGVLAGSLWTSAVKPGVFLSGASGGVSRGWCCRRSTQAVVTIMKKALTVPPAACRPAARPL